VNSLNYQPKEDWMEGEGGAQWHLADPEATTEWGRAWAPYLESGLVLTFSGDLGAGKTALIRGILRGLGVTGTIRSPTYALLEIYELSRLYCYHFDFYRINSPESLEDSGFRECFRSDSLCLVEWPEKVSTWLPPADVALMLEPAAGAGRLLQVRHTSVHGMKCLEPLLATSLPR
jgi:tRNA threonylcarbamoyladenosine biosynthesis protein TsaE